MIISDSDGTTNGIDDDKNKRQRCHQPNDGTSVHEKKEDEEDEYSTRGYVIIPNCLDLHVLHALRRECDRLHHITVHALSHSASSSSSTSTSSSSEQPADTISSLYDTGCVVEPMPSGDIHDTHAARTVRHAYTTLRANSLHQLAHQDSKYSPATPTPPPLSSPLLSASSSSSASSIVLGNDKKANKATSSDADSSSSSSSSSDIKIDSNVITNYIFSESLRHLVKGITKWSDVYLFNEHYVVKAANDRRSSFAWHTDAAEQLGMCSEEERVPYISLWYALDDVNEGNGGLWMLPLNIVAQPNPFDSLQDEDDDIEDEEEVRMTRSTAAVVAAAAAAAAIIDDKNNKEKKNDDEVVAATTAQVGAAHAQSSAPAAAAAPAGSLRWMNHHSQLLCVSSGSLVAFSSLLWHRSSPNLSDRVRRVFYLQFTPKPIITKAPPTPIAFAVPLS